MNTQEIINNLTKDQIRTDLPELVVGNNVKVYQKIVEGSRTRTWPVNSPNIEKIEVSRKGKVRRAKLYYLRDRVGKAAKVKERI